MWTPVSFKMRSVGWIAAFEPEDWESDNFKNQEETGMF